MDLTPSHLTLQLSWAVLEMCKSTRLGLPMPLLLITKSYPQMTQISQMILSDGGINC